MFVRTVISPVSSNFFAGGGGSGVRTVRTLGGRVRAGAAGRVAALRRAPFSAPSRRLSRDVDSGFLPRVCLGDVTVDAAEIKPKDRARPFGGLLLSSAVAAGRRGPPCTRKPVGLSEPRGFGRSRGGAVCVTARRTRLAGVQGFREAKG